VYQLTILVECEILPAIQQKLFNPLTYINFPLIGGWYFLPNILVQMMLFCGKQFKIYYTAKLYVVFSGTCCVSDTTKYMTGRDLSMLTDWS